MTALAQDTLHKLLESCDAQAVENVRAGRGGPFAASVHVYNEATAALQTVVEPVGNAVLETGLASAHAEDRAIVPANVEKLKEILAVTGSENAHVYVVSSAESCPACHAKLEILARKLIHAKLLLPGRFTVVYGADYGDTEKIAGFRDAPYHDDFQKAPGTGLVKQSVMHAAELPEMIRKRMMDAVEPLALIVTKDRPLVGMGEYPEMEVIRLASAAQARVRIDAPWNLRGATLYTFTRDIGPLCYAECQWANIARWISVEHPAARAFATQEAPGISNGALFRIVAARPYINPDSALRLQHLIPFENRAQHEWAARPDLVRYNGA